MCTATYSCILIGILIMLFPPGNISWYSILHPCKVNYIVCIDQRGNFKREICDIQGERKKSQSWAVEII